jgi:hypothetical protein
MDKNRAHSPEELAKQEWDVITEPQAWIDGLEKAYSPNASDVDCAMQNMGLHISELEAEISAMRKLKNG